MWILIPSISRELEMKPVETAFVFLEKNGENLIR